ncbi:MAG TPA: hypothetical protein VMZ28_12505 [Kofleriaceae bacterium]|nr:hypothetical protein [Kofleriaceae bacterium]
MRRPLMLLAVLAACDQPQTQTQTQTQPPALPPTSSTSDAAAPAGPPPRAHTAPPSTLKDFALLDLDTYERPAGLTQDGVEVVGMRWTDKNGPNVAVLIHQVEDGGDVTNRRLWAFHYIDGPPPPRILRKVQDKVESCAFDNNAHFIDDSLEVTDVDADGLAEVWFAYQLGCTSDVSPLPLKLLVIENGEKYILRGTTMKGAPTEEPPRARWPAGVRDRAGARWKELSR